MHLCAVARLWVQRAEPAASQLLQRGAELPPFPPRLCCRLQAPAVEDVLVQLDRYHRTIVQLCGGHFSQAPVSRGLPSKLPWASIPPPPPLSVSFSPFLTLFCDHSNDAATSALRGTCTIHHQAGLLWAGPQVFLPCPNPSTSCMRMALPLHVQLAFSSILSSLCGFIEAAPCTLSSFDVVSLAPAAGTWPSAPRACGTYGDCCAGRHRVFIEQLQTQRPTHLINRYVIGCKLTKQGRKYC